MGAPSLVFGIISILAGFYLLFEILESIELEPEHAVFNRIAIIIFPVPLMVIGGLLLRKFVRDMKTNKLLDEREGIKTPKVAGARKCPTCSQESHDKIGDHYKCLNPDCGIDTFQE